MSRLSIQFSDRGSDFAPEEAHIIENKSYASSVVSIGAGDRYSLMPLDRHRHEMRLIQLLPSKDKNSPVECQLSVVSRDDGPIYTALSYAWGNAAQVAPIQVNGLEWWVTESLYLALLHIRKADEPLTLWIDAICIDQKNDEEKSWHVQQMRDTFLEAANVIAWLGPAEEAEVEAMQMLKKIGEIALSIAPEADLWSDATHDKVLALYDKATAKKTNLRNPLEKLFHDIVHETPGGHRFVQPGTWHIFNQTWWQRVWVVQELAVSSQVTFQCGNSRISDQLMLAAALLYHEYKNSVWSAQRNVPDQSSYETRLADFLRDDAEDDATCIYAQCTTRWAYRSWANSPSGLPLAFIISSTFAYDTTRVLAATDPRDYVFGLLGLATDTAKLGLVADYTKSNAEVFTDFSRALIRHGNFLPLSWCCNRGSDRLKGLPSWAVDLSSKIKRPFQWYVRDLETGGYKFDPTYSAGLGLAHVYRSTLEPASNNKSSSNTLILSGVDVDTVLYTGPLFDDLHSVNSSKSQSVARTCLEFLQEVKNLLEAVKKQEVYTSEESAAAAVWATSIADVEISPTWERKRSGGQLSQLQKDLYANSFPDSEDLSGLDSLKLTFDAMDSINLHRRPFVTTRGYVGLGPEEIQSSDLVTVFSRSQIPIILRNIGDIFVSVVGDAYVHGIMDGEIKDSPHRVRDFYIR